MPIIVPTAGGTFNVDTRGRGDTGSACPNGGGPQIAFAVWLTQDSRVTAEVVAASYDTYLQMRTTCADSGALIGCDDDGGDGNRAEIRRDLQRGAYFVILDGFNGQSGSARVQFTIERR